MQQSTKYTVHIHTQFSCIWIQERLKPNPVTHQDHNFALYFLFCVWSRGAYQVRVGGWVCVNCVSLSHSLSLHLQRYIHMPLRIYVERILYGEMAVGWRILGVERWCGRRRKGFKVEGRGKKRNKEHVLKCSKDQRMRGWHVESTESLLWVIGDFWKSSVHDALAIAFLYGWNPYIYLSFIF